jgi:oxaloacetate decarboxylase alpha subunit
MGVDRIYLKDHTGLLTLQTVRDVLKIMHENANGLPIEIHSHATSALADQSYATALEDGLCTTFHVGMPPLAEGNALPSIFNTVANAKALGYEVDLDMERAAHVSKRLYRMAKEEGLPTDFGPNRYRVTQKIHRIPGGVLSNMIHQLRELHIQDRVDEVIDEVVRICADTGEPNIITPYAQYICTQAAINVALGERYKVVIDNWITYAMGANGEESGYLQMDPNLRDKFLSLPRAKELQEIRENIANTQAMTLKDVRRQYGENLSDEDLILHVIMSGNEGEIETMRQATKEHPFHQYTCNDTPIIDLINELSKQPHITQVQVQFQDKSLLLNKENAQG